MESSFVVKECCCGKGVTGGPERPLCEAMKVKSGLGQRPQDFGDARAGAKESCKHGVVPAQEREVCACQQSWKVETG